MLVLCLVLFEVGVVLASVAFTAHRLLRSVRRQRRCAATIAEVLRVAAELAAARVADPPPTHITLGSALPSAEQLVVGAKFRGNNCAEAQWAALELQQAVERFDEDMANIYTKHFMPIVRAALDEAARREAAGEAAEAADEWPVEPPDHYADEDSVEDSWIYHAKKKDQTSGVRVHWVAVNLARKVVKHWPPLQAEARSRRWIHSLNLMADEQNRAAEEIFDRLAEEIARIEYTSSCIGGTKVFQDVHQLLAKDRKAADEGAAKIMRGPEGQHALQELKLQMAQRHRAALKLVTAEQKRAIAATGPNTPSKKKKKKSAARKDAPVVGPPDDAAPPPAGQSAAD
eukprot:Selendium_serpulae@DN3365_c1_g1_i2.p1